MQELRHLFGLMMGSRRKYVDPSKAVDILKEAFSSTVVSNTSVNDSQQVRQTDFQKYSVFFKDSYVYYWVLLKNQTFKAVDLLKGAFNLTVAIPEPVTVNMSGNFQNVL